MVKVIRSTRKSMCLQVLDTEEVIVRVPLHVSEASIREFIRSHSAWIEHSLVKARERKDNTLHITPKEVLTLRSAAKEQLIPRVYELGEQLGLKPKGVTIRNQKTRWGSCSSRHTISLNCQLMLLDEELRDYVIVHELCHIKFFNHSNDFWNLVYACMPNAKVLRQALRVQMIQSCDSSKETGEHHEY